MSRFTDDLNNTPIKDNQFKEIDEKYAPLFTELEEKSKNLNKQIYEIMNNVEKERRALTAEEQAIFDDFKELGEEYADLTDEWEKEKQIAEKEAKAQALNPLFYTSDAEKVLEYIKDGVPRLIHSCAFMSENETVNEKRELNSFSNIIFNDTVLKAHIYSAFSYHLSFLAAKAPDSYKEACDFIDDCIKDKDNIEAYINKKTSYRTKAKAKEEFKNIYELSKYTPTITEKQHQYGLGFCQRNDAYLWLVTDIKELLTNSDGLCELSFEKGELYFEKLPNDTKIKLINMITKKGIEEINLPVLRLLFGIIVEYYEDRHRGKIENFDGIGEIDIYVPALAEKMGITQSISNNVTKGIIGTIYKYQNIIGVLKKKIDGKTYNNLLPVLLFKGYYEDKNIIGFESPYMNYLVKEINKARMITDKKGKPIIDKKTNVPLIAPAYSFMVYSSICKERNKAAVEIVYIIVTLIEQTGSQKKDPKTNKIIPHKAAKNIIEECKQFQVRLETTANKGQLLRRTFSKAWELLRTKTRLLDEYVDLELPELVPDPKDQNKKRWDPRFIPTLRNLDTLVFEFPHRGKRKK